LFDHSFALGTLPIFLNSAAADGFANNQCSTVISNQSANDQFQAGND